jgi:hypothetical protein
VFPARYKLNFYILFRRNSVFEYLKAFLKIVLKITPGPKGGEITDEFMSIHN